MENNLPENFVLIPGGTFQMGSPQEEAWRSADEKQHAVTVSDFYMSVYELTQAEYQEIMQENPSSFSGDDLPVESISWLDAVRYCNARSEKEGLTPAYTINGSQITWDRSADGYRLPTEAEWEYACRAGTATPFNTETSISAEECNYYGHYPYEIENNYFSQGNLDTQPGEYRQTTLAVDSFSPNKWGLYNMHGNVGEWVWDYYGDYGTSEQIDPAGPETGTLRVYRGGGWNDFAKNMRSAYRATLAEDKGSFNIGLLAVATWLGKAGKNNKMFLFPMAFMLIVTITSLCFTLKANFTGIAAGGAGVAWCYVRAVISALLIVLAVILAVDGTKTMAKQKK